MGSRRPNPADIQSTPIRLDWDKVPFILIQPCPVFGCSLKPMDKEEPLLFDTISGTTDSPHTISEPLCCFVVSTKDRRLLTASLSGLFGRLQAKLWIIGRTLRAMILPGNFFQLGRVFKIMVLTLAILIFLSISFIVREPKMGLSDILDSAYGTASREILLESEMLSEYAKNRLGSALEAKDIREFAFRMRVYARMFKAYQAARFPTTELRNTQRSLNLMDQETAQSTVEDAALPSDGTTDKLQEIVRYPKATLLWQLEKSLFPWANVQFPTLLDQQKSFVGRGILIPTGHVHFKYCIHLIRSLRYFGCTLPITVAYAGEKDLHARELKLLHELDVSTLDIHTTLNNTIAGLGGWEIKPFALLAVPYKEVIMMDADVVFLQNPESLFESEPYKRDHAVIFHDRTLFAGDAGKTRWLDANLPAPLSKRVLGSRMYKQLSAHEQESGVVVINKEKRLLGLLAACKMNCRAERDEVIYKNFYGDKETYWIGFEIANETYGELQERPGSIGWMRVSPTSGKPEACGRILHFDQDGMPLWFNGGIVKNKRTSEGEKEVGTFTHWGTEGIWDFGSECIAGPIHALNEQQRKVVDEMGALYQPQFDLEGN